MSLCRCRTAGGPTTPDAESSRIRRVREAVEWGRCLDGTCIVPPAPPLDANLDVCPDCGLRPDFTPGTTPSERDRILREVTACELYYTNQHTGGLCAGQREGIHAPIALGATDPATGSRFTSHPPHRVQQARTMPRIRGIEEIARLVRGPTAAELTARRRQHIEGSTARHAEHFRATPLPPERLQCTIVGGTSVPRHRQRSQAGVPVAPITPCVLGNQRVDYSTGTF
jgi:hypothetical protein